MYKEMYGSDAIFAVMCPNTTYWQGTISDVVKTLASEWGVDGVYIDQISAGNL